MVQTRSKNHIIDQIPASVILDLSNVAHVDVTGLEALIEGLNIFKTNDIPLRLTSTSTAVHRMLMDAVMYKDCKDHAAEFEASRQTLDEVLHEIPGELATRYTALTKSKRTPGKIEEDLLSP